MLKLTDRSLGGLHTLEFYTKCVLLCGSVAHILIIIANVVLFTGNWVCIGYSKPRNIALNNEIFFSFFFHQVIVLLTLNDLLQFIT